MAVRGLGNPVRLALTPDQAGDAPRAHTLPGGLEAQYVMADAAYDSGRLRKQIAGIGARRVPQQSLPATQIRAR